MSTELTWLGHGTWLIETGEHKLLLDPFLDDNPSAPIKADDVEADYLVISHGHFDHVADAVKIARRTGAVCIANFEICQWLQGQGVAEDKCLPHNTGGGSDQPFGRIKLTIAHHSSMLPDGSNGGNPCGVLLNLPEGDIYFACDTALFGDMKLIYDGKIDLAVLPIGDLFTMGPDDALTATEFVDPVRVAPAHYNTWPPIEQDAAAWAEDVKSRTNAEPVVVEPGGKIKL